MLCLAGLSLAALPQNLTITLDTYGYCNTTNQFRIGDICSFKMIIQIPTTEVTTMHIELFSSDNSSTVMAQLCKPNVTVGSNYNVTAPIPVLSSSLGYSQVFRISLK